MSASRYPDHEQLDLFARAAEHSASYIPPRDVAVYRVTLVREAGIPLQEVQLRTSADVERLIRAHLAGADREHFVVILLNRKNEMIGINTVSMGSLTSSVVIAREVFKPAILANAAGIICGHNHPTGHPEPSHEDRELTKRLVKAGKLLGIPVIDHVIIGDGTTAYYSFADQGTLG